MNIRFKKIKITSEEKINIVYEKTNNSGKMDEYSMTCSDKARPEFYDVMQALATEVIDMCELPNDYIDRILVRSVSFSYGGDKEVMGATITAQMVLNKSNCNLNLNTPHKASDSYSDGDADEKQLLSADCIDALKALCAEAELYIDGDRAQMKLFDAA